MLINAERRPLQLELKTSLERLPREIAWGSPLYRLSKRLFLTVFLGVFPILVAVRVWELKRDAQLSRDKLTGRFVAGQVVSLLIASALFGYFVTLGIAWLLLRLIY